MALVFPSSPTPGQTYVGPNNITYTWDNTLGVWTGSSPAAGGLTAASLAQAAAGTLNTVAATPQTAVPKDASGMTGAAIIPNGTTAQRAAITFPANGFLRFNSALNLFEAYVSAASNWFQIPFIQQVPSQPNKTVTNGEILSGVIYCNDFVVPAGVTCTVSGSIYVFAQGNVTIPGNIQASSTGPRGAESYGTSYVTSNGNVPGGLGTGPSPGNSNAGGPAVGPAVALTGSGGSGGYIGSIGYPGGSVNLSTSGGGSAGASVLIRALGSITLTGGIIANGETAFTPPSPNSLIVISGGGGGSGGVIILDADGTCVNSGSIQANGGDGGVGVNVASGGGGGGGGIVIVQSRYSTATLGTVTVAAGTFGASNTGIGGGGGGGCGGRGGDSNSAFTELATAGIAQTFGSPLSA